MSHAWYINAPDEKLDEANIIAKQRLARDAAIWAHTMNRIPVSEIARLVGCSRPTVIEAQRRLPSPLRKPGLGI